MNLLVDQRGLEPLRCIKPWAPKAHASANFATDPLVSAPGLEPGTVGLENQSSIRLS